MQNESRLEAWLHNIRCSPYIAHAAYPGSQKYGPSHKETRMPHAPVEHRAPQAQTWRHMT